MDLHDYLEQEGLLDEGFDELDEYDEYDEEEEIESYEAEIEGMCN
jgi:hypothetical protein